MRHMAMVAFLVVSVAGCQRRDPLFCGQNPNDLLCAGDGSIGGDAPYGYFFIGGTVTGKSGGGLVLLNSGGDDKLVASDGAFQFASPIPTGTNYDVTVGTQPTNPSQTCTVGNGAGIATADVTNVQVACATASYKIGGTVVGFIPGTLVLTDNGGDNLTITGNGAFRFATGVASGSAYSVAIGSQGGVTCNVSGGLGVVGNADVSSVVVNCMPGTFTIGGTVSGLNGTATLHNGVDTIPVTTNGSFAFPTPIMGGAGLTYNVTVTAQPTFPPASQTCVVTNGSGTVFAANITTVTVTCTTNRFTIGGTVSGLTGTVVLRNNGADTTSITANGPFTFATSIFSGFTYAVTVQTQPSGFVCTVTNGSGTVKNANITNVTVACVVYVDPGIRCSGAYCGAGQQCCISDQDPPPPKCIASGAPCAGLTVPCDDNAECGAVSICCATQTTGQNAAVTGVACAATCSGAMEIQLCNPAVGGCASGTCSAYGLLAGYHACQ